MPTLDVVRQIAQYVLEDDVQPAAALHDSTAAAPATVAVQPPSPKPQRRRSAGIQGSAATQTAVASAEQSPAADAAPADTLGTAAAQQQPEHRVHPPLQGSEAGAAAAELDALPAEARQDAGESHLCICHWRHQLWCT